MSVGGKCPSTWGNVLKADKCPSREMSGGVNVLVGKFLEGVNVLVGKFLEGISVLKEKCPEGENVLVGKCPEGDKCPNGEMS